MRERKRIFGSGDSTTSMCGARTSCERNCSTCMRIRCRESWCNIRGIGLGAVGRTTRGRERAEFRSIQTEEGTWKQQLRGRVKTRTLKTEGCGTPKSKPTARGSPPGQNSDRFRPRWERGSSDFGEESKPAPLKP